MQVIDELDGKKYDPNLGGRAESALKEIFDFTAVQNKLILDKFSP